jgi:hypothetical protein
MVHLASAMWPVFVSNLVSSIGHENSTGSGSGNSTGNGNDNGTNMTIESKEAAATIINIEKIEIENPTIVKGKSYSAEVKKGPRFHYLSGCREVYKFLRRSI